MKIVAIGEECEVIVKDTSTNGSTSHSKKHFKNAYFVFMLFLEKKNIKNGYPK